MPQSLLQQWYDEVWNNENEAAIDELLDENAEVDGLETDAEKRGPEAFRPFYKSFRDAFPSVNVELEPIFANDEIEVAKCFVRATTREGKQVNFTGLTVARFRNGKLIKGWNAFDFLTMNKQLETATASEFEQPQ